jgi:hypothetical protein
MDRIVYIIFRLADNGYNASVLSVWATREDAQRIIDNRQKRQLAMGKPVETLDIKERVVRGAST